MNRFIFIFFFYFSSLFADNITLSEAEKSYLASKNNTITMCVDPDWEPFEKIKNGKHIGLASDLIALVEKKLSITIKLLPTKTWEESLEFSKSGKCDIMSFLNDTPKRREWLTFTEPLFSDPNVLVGRFESEYVEDISKLNASIALPKGTAMAELFARDFPNLTIVPVETENEAFKLVEDKKVDMTLRSLVITAYTIKKDGLFNLKIIGTPKGYENHLRIGVDKTQPILRDILNKGIETITKEEREDILNNYVKIVVEQVTILSIGIYIGFGLFFLGLLVMIWNYQLRKKVVFEVAKNAEIQKKVFEQNKKAELGNLIANISHQWRDSLSEISSLNMFVMAQLQNKIEITPQMQLENGEKIEKSIDFMSDTMNKFLSFYKQSSIQSKFTLFEVLQETLGLIEMKTKHEKLTIVIENQFAAIEIEGIKNEWMNIYLNIIVNTLNIVKKRGISHPILTIHFTEDGVVFEDNCGGIEKDILETLEGKSGTGLGLVMANEILQKNHFTLIIENNLKGASFFIKKIKL